MSNLVLVVIIVVSAPAWVPLLFIAGGFIVAGLALLCAFIFIAIAEFCDGVSRGWRGSKRKLR